MGFRLKIKGETEEILLGMENILEAGYKSDTPDDSDARATDIGVIITVTGKIITPVQGETEDDTRKLAKWSLVSSEKADAYRDLTLEVISGDIMVRSIHLPNAFIVDYTEDYTDKRRIGVFKAIFKQKKEKTTDVTLEGGYASEN